MAVERPATATWEWLERELVKRIERAEAARSTGETLLRLLAKRSSRTRFGPQAHTIPIVRQPR